MSLELNELGATCSRDALFRKASLLLANIVGLYIVGLGEWLPIGVKLLEVRFKREMGDGRGRVFQVMYGADVLSGDVTLGSRWVWIKPARLVHQERD